MARTKVSRSKVTRSKVGTPRSKRNPIPPPSYPTFSGSPSSEVLSTTSVRISFSTNEATTAYIEYGTTTAYGSSTSVDGSATAHVITITGLTANTLYHYRARATNSQANETLGSDQTVTTAAALTLGVYGPAVVGDELNNVQLGTPASGTKANPQSYRFRALYTGNLTSFVFYTIGPGHSGYGAGTGGTWKVELKADDGTGAHLPTGAALATQTMPADATAGATTATRTVTFSSPYSVTSGTLYHLVLTNTDADTTSNYFSTDLWHCDTNVMQPGYQAVTTDGNPQPVDLGWLGFSSGTWNSSNLGGRTFMPIMDLTIGGNHQGQGYMEASYASGEWGVVNGANNKVRMRFTPTSTIQVNAVNLRTWMLTGGSDDLTVTLANAGGTLATATVTNANITKGAAPSASSNAITTGLGRSRWVASAGSEVALSSVVTLTANTEYTLTLSLPAGSTCYVPVQRYYSGYNSATAWRQGVSERTTNGSTWSSLGRVANSNTISFYLVTQFLL